MLNEHLLSSRRLVWFFRCGHAVLLSCIILAVLVKPAGGVELTDAQIKNKRCMNCHGQSHITNLTPEQLRTMILPNGSSDSGDSTERPGLYVDLQILQGTAHADLSCVSCHTDADKLPHKAQLAKVSCSNQCHETEATAFRRGVHAEAVADKKEQAPTCSTCHGTHQILPKSNRNSLIYPLNIIQVCGNCHSEFTDESSSDPVKSYLQSVHGRAVSEGGLVVAATCADCHRSHDVMGAEDEESSVHRDNIPKTCGKCHVGIAETFKKSVHGQAVIKGDQKAPVCVDCHTAHAITRSSTPQFIHDIINECGHCHNEPVGEGKRSLYETYRMSYHGQVTELGSDSGAKCSDCHGAHDILPIADPNSRLHENNLVNTCASCHPRANANFVKFMPHADYTDPSKSKVLYYVWIYFIIVITGTFSFFGLHTILWFIRSLVHRIKHGPHQFDRSAPGIKRFNRVDRINHAIMIVSFFGLTLTGMPLFFAGQPWAKTLAWVFGGINAAGWWHRLFAIMLVGNFLLHFAGVINRIHKHSMRGVIFGPNSMLPRWQDAKDMLGMFKWFFGGKKPTFDRWTYWEKFDYWAEIFGTTVIGVSGLMLWFPELFAEFLPGWSFNIASLVHGYEALLAAVFIFTVHFFNAHLRWEKFPVDDIMFTGQLPEEEYKEERGLEYQRVVEAGELESLRVQPAPWWYRPVAVCIGILAMLIGTGIVVLIVLAVLGVLR